MGNENSQAKGASNKNVSLKDDKENVDANQKKRVDKSIKKLQNSSKLPSYLMEIKKKAEEIKKQEVNELDQAKTLLGLQPCTTKKHGNEKVS